MPEAPRNSFGGHVWPPRLLLVAYAAALVLGVVPKGSAPEVSDLLDVRSPGALADLLRALVSGGVVWTARFIPLGVFAALSMTRRDGALSRLLNVWLPAGVVSGLLMIAVLVLEAGRPWSWPTTPELMLPGLGVFVGISLGVSMTKGWGGIFGLIGGVVIAVLVVLGLGAALLYRSLEPRPLDFEQPKITSEHKRRLYGMFKGLNPKTIPPGETRTLRLSAQDLNLLLAWGLSLGPNGRKVEVETATDQATLLASAPLPGGRYLNLLASGEADIAGGGLTLHVRRLRIGRTEAPGLLLDIASPYLARLAARDRRVKPVLNAVKDVEMTPKGVVVTYGSSELPPGFVADLFRGEEGRAELPAVKAHVEHLLAAPRVADTEVRFARAVETAFRFAAERSRSGSAASENRAAILALGMLLGHPRVESLVGQVMTDAERREARHAHRGATLRGRGDWTQHFWVSASLTVLAMESVSDATGLLKEELDAGGGSGFSFGDLLADRAGTTFASVATRDEASARAIQVRLARGFSVGDFFPPADGLPEGLQDAELKARYGGVGGAEYAKLAGDIERRIAACAAYR